MITPRCEKFRGQSDPFNGYRHNSSLSLRACSEFHEREVDIGIVDHTFHSVPLFTLFTQHYELIEDLDQKVGL
jgi:hypothetical protein